MTQVISILVSSPAREALARIGLNRRRAEQTKRNQPFCLDLPGKEDTEQLLPQAVGTQVDAENRNLPEQKPPNRKLHGHQCQGGKAWAEMDEWLEAQCPQGQG